MHILQRGGNGSCSFEVYILRGVKKKSKNDKKQLLKNLLESQKSRHHSTVVLTENRWSPAAACPMVSASASVVRGDARRWVASP